MKLRNIIISGLGIMSLTACNDYLDVDAPSKHDIAKIYGSTKETGTALNGVYRGLLENNTFGQAFTYSLILNSDVDFNSNSSSTRQTNTPKRYDVDASSSTANGVWNATYNAIESANNFIYNLSNSSIYKESSDDWRTLSQYMGEAKAIRAMLYNELMCYWGDVPFPTEPTSATGDYYPAITSRDTIAKRLILDLEAAAANMQSSDETTIERISQEACYGIIARIALQAAGFSLRHAEDDASTYGYMAKPAAETETWFLEKAREYAGKVIESHKHELVSSYQDVFLAECNFELLRGDDPIFEIPFAQESSGSIGYRQGPKFASNGGVTNYEWGETGGNQQVSMLHRFSYKPGDTRKNATIGWWEYTYDGTPKIIGASSLSMYNNKWSKLWNRTKAFNSSTASNTGINYPYLRYADVLLMWAEADVKLTGNVSDEAKECVQKVRNRAYIGSGQAAPAVVGASPDAFLKEILDERKWEFAGENSRWKDLVRNNMLSEVLYYTFMRNHAVALNMGGASEGAEEDLVQAYDGVDYFSSNEVYTQEEVDAAMPGDDAYGKTVGRPKSQLLTTTIYYCYIDNPKDNSFFANSELPTIYVYNPEAYVAQPKGDIGSPEKFFKFMKNNFPNSVKSTYNPIPEPNNASSSIKNPWESRILEWYDDAALCPKDGVLYSLYGFIHAGETGETAKNTIYVVRDGVEERIDLASVNVAELPVVRYLLPIPREAITRSSGAYKNYYGY